jgi:hypothetical protein
MARNPSAYLIDSLEACLAIQDVLTGVNLSTYGSRRAIRSAVEREFIWIPLSMISSHSCWSGVSRFEGAEVSFDYEPFPAS